MLCTVFAWTIFAHFPIKFNIKASTLMELENDAVISDCELKRNDMNIMNKK